MKAQDSWLDVFGIPALSDNYIWIIPTWGNRCVVFDPSEAVPVVKALALRNLVPEAILITHHHLDHVGGVAELREHYGVAVIAPFSSSSACLVEEVVEEFKQGGSWTKSFGSLFIEAMHTPGHTREHTSYLCVRPSAKQPAFIAGDALFSLGCGRLLEGTAHDLCHTLSTIKRLPSETLIFSAHEYSLKNWAFAAQFSNSGVLKERYIEIELARNDGLPTYPVSLSSELQTNPFFLAFEAEFRASLPGTPGNALDAITFLRAERDRF